MTAEQLEELLSDLNHGSKFRRDSAHDDLSALAPSLARRVLAAARLIKKMDSVIESRHIIVLLSKADIDELEALDDAYREASK